MKLKEYNFIKERREELEITQRELTKKIGMGQSTYSRFENTDFKEIRLCDLEKIIKVLFDEDFDILQEIAVFFDTTQGNDSDIKINLPLPENEELHKPEFDLSWKEDLEKEVEYHKSLNNGLREENDELCEEVVQLQKDKSELKKIISQLTTIF